MKLIRIDISNIAYTEKRVSMASFPDLIENCEKLLFETGVYKNGPTTIETCLSTFGKQEKSCLRFIFRQTFQLKEMMNSNI